MKKLFKVMFLTALVAVFLWADFAAVHAVDVGTQTDDPAPTETPAPKETAKPTETKPTAPEEPRICFPGCRVDNVPIYIYAIDGLALYPQWVGNIPNGWIKVNWSIVTPYQVAQVYLQEVGLDKEWVLYGFPANAASVERVTILGEEYTGLFITLAKKQKEQTAPQPAPQNPLASVAPQPLPKTLPKTGSSDWLALSLVASALVATGAYFKKRKR